MIYNAVDIAYYILDYSKREFNQGISNLKIQKILYFIQAEFLVSKNQPCFKDKIEAWDFGPVIPAVYQEYKVYGGSNIPYYNQSYGAISEADKKLINGIIYQCKDFSASTLTEITHDQKPWKDVYWTNCTDLYSKYNKYPTITNESIKEFFSNTENH